ncbi:MAG TPA: alpha/beta hydrolase-fold protein, partial [Fimbriimonadaceae bacterium]|nr:alpha/beta hydrolase-fold protein [Fimbriimonadaceae bacterium]
MPFVAFHWFSQSLQKHSIAHIIVPSVPRPWHPMLLLHGLSDDHSGWMRRTSVERYCDGLPLLVVMPDGGRSFYTDAAHGPKVETALSVELPELMESVFSVGPRWAVAGLSMGGYGALKFGMKNPKRFIAAASMSGAVQFGNQRWGETEEFDLIVPPEHLGGTESLDVLATVGQPPALWMDCGLDDHLLED